MISGYHVPVRLQTRVLAETLALSLTVILLLSVMFFISMAGIRDMALVNSGTLGDSAAEISSYALEEQVTDNIARIASDMAVILDEKLLKIENHTRTTADIAGSIYTRKESYRPHPLPQALPGETPPPEPYLHTAPGVELAAIRAETELAGNIGDMLRQIMVVDPGITTSTIGGEAGYIIAMDAFPWPSKDFDPRTSPWYAGAREKSGLYWTSVYEDLRERGPAVACAMPFYDQSGGRNLFKGVARSTVLLADFTKIIDSAKVGRTGYVFLLDQAGWRLFSSGRMDVRIGGDGRIIGENYLESPNPRLRSLGLSMTLGAEGMTALEIDGIPVYAAYAPITTLGWSLGVAIPVQEIAEPAQLIKARIRSLTDSTADFMDRRVFLLAGHTALMLVLTLLIAAFLSLRFTRAVTKPILALNEGVREVSAGNLDREVLIKTGDELEQLAGSFNTMTARLREHIAAVAAATAEKERIATELNVATQIQTSMLPYIFPPFPDRDDDFDLYAAVHPAREVGGDFYDFFFIDDGHFAALIADVSGKGIPAALFMAITKTLIKNRLQTGAPPERALESINRQLCGNNIADMFVTLWLGVLEISSGRLDYINAGHNPPLLKTGERGFSFLASAPDLFLAGMEDTAYHRRQVFLKPGDTLFLYTDGVTEAMDTGGSLYGPGRLRAFLDAQGELSVRDLLNRLRADIEAFSQGAEAADDMTMLALRITR